MAQAGAAKLSSRRTRNLTGILLAVVALAACVVLLSGDPRLLVALSSNRDGQSLLPSGSLAPGQATSGQLVLANEGLLPLTYTLTVTGGPDEAQVPVLMRVRRLDRDVFLYQGPPPRQPVTLGRMRPGEHVQLEVLVIAPAGGASASIPADYTFTWTGRSPGFTAWWWIVPIALLLLLAGLGLPRLYALAQRLRARRAGPKERYWRAPVILALVLLAALIPLTGVSLSSVNAQTQNPANVFSIGSLILSDRGPTGVTCLSVAGDQAQPVQSRCDALFRFSGERPGRSGTAQVTIRNAGSIPVGRFQLWTTGCASSDNPDEPFHGTGDLCGGVNLSVHDDSHDACYYPIRTAGACPASPAGSLAAFTAGASPARPLVLDPDGLGGGVTFTFSLTLDPAAGNELQGRSAAMDLFWQVSS